MVLSSSRVKLEQIPQLSRVHQYAWCLSHVISTEKKKPNLLGLSLMIKIVLVQFVSCSKLKHEYSKSYNREFVNNILSSH